MIPSPTEIAYALYGAWRLARLDPGGMSYFDRSVEGFWKSFFAALLVAPGHILLLVIELSDVELAAALPRIVVVLAIIYVMSWTAFPLAMHYLTQTMNRAAEYTGVIIANNWAQVIQILLLTPVTAVARSGLLPGGLGGLLWFAAFCAILYYSWFIARTALRISGPAAVGIVAFSFVLDYTIGSFGLAMIR